MKMNGHDAPSGLFIRQSSGLVRELGLRDTFGMAVSIILLGSAFSNFALGLTAIRGADYTIAMLLATGLAAVSALMYSQLTAVFPRTGGDFIYASRTVHPVFGAAIGGALLLALIVDAGLVVLFTSKVWLPLLVRSIGAAVSNQAVINLAGTLATPNAAFGTGLVVVLVLIFLSTRPLRVATAVIFWLMLLSAVGFATTMVVLATHNQADFVAAFNDSASKSNAYPSIISTAHSLGWSTGVIASATLASFPFAYITLAGYWIGNVAGGEIRRPARIFTVGLLLALLVGGGTSLIAWLTLTHAVNLDFMQAAAWLSQAHPGTYGQFSGDNPLAGGLDYATMLAGNPVVKVVIGATLPLGGLAICIAYFLLASRAIFALAFDRLLPEPLASVSANSHSPISAVVATAIGAVALVVAGNYGSGIVPIFRNLVLVLFTLFFLTSLVAMVVPYRRPDLYNAAPKIFAGRWLTLPPLTVLGAISAVGNGAAAVLIATQPAISGGYDALSIATLVVIALFGVALYGIAWWRLRRHGIPLGFAMQELPPE